MTSNYSLHDIEVMIAIEFPGARNIVASRGSPSQVFVALHGLSNEKMKAVDSFLEKLGLASTCIERTF
jgi:hypothetical protein